MGDKIFKHIGFVESRNAEIAIGDLEDDYASPLNIDLCSGYFRKKNNNKSLSSIIFELNADGLYPVYATINKNKIVEKIHIQLSEEENKNIKYTGEKTKLIDLKISSGSILISDMPPLRDLEYALELTETKRAKVEIKKDLIESFGSIKKSMKDELAIMVPVINGKYSVYSYDLEMYNSEFEDSFHIVIEKIKGCHLSKGHLKKIV
jgi:hypothetical protein